MRSSRRIEAADVARTAPPVLLLLLAAAVPAWAGVATVGLVLGTVVAVGRRAPVAWAWAATVPAGVLAAVRALSGLTPFGAEYCEAFSAPYVVWALVEATVVVAGSTVLMLALHARRGSIGVRLPARGVVRLAVGGGVAIAIGGLLVVSVIGGRLPGPDGADPSGVALAAAVLAGAMAIGIAEELAFRGALLGWLARTIDEWPAVIVQAVVYGTWVTAAGWGLPFGVAAAAAGLVAGTIAVSTRSLLVPLAWHIGVAIPLLAWILCGG